MAVKDRTTAMPRGKKAAPAPVLVTSDGLAEQVRTGWAGTAFTDDEFRAVVGLLHGPGVVWRLAFGDLVLLQPERINAYAAALVRTVRKHHDEMGVILESAVLAGELEFADMARLPAEPEAIVLRAMHQMVVDRGLCIRRRHADDDHLLIFPSLHKRERPERPGDPLPLATFRFEGHLDEVYATLVVRLHHTDLFEYQKLWLDAADFVSRADEKLVLRMTRHEGQGEVTLYTDGAVSEVTRILFDKYVEDHLKAHDPNCVRLRHYACGKCGRQFRDTRAVDEARADGMKHVCCGRCGRKIVLDDKIEQKRSAAGATRQAQEMRAEAQAVLDNESKELILEGHSRVIAGEAGQTYITRVGRDFGIDGEIEFKTDGGEASVFKVYLQLKSGDSYLAERKDGTEVFTKFNQRHVEYWRKQAYPVMLVVRTSDGRIRWMDVRAYLQREHEANRPVKRIAFAGQPFTSQSLLALREQCLLAGRS